MIASLSGWFVAIYGGYKFFTRGKKENKEEVLSSSDNNSMLQQLIRVKSMLMQNVCVHIYIIHCHKIDTLHCFCCPGWISFSHTTAYVIHQFSSPLQKVVEAAK